MTDKGENIFDPWLGPKRTNPVKTWDMPEDYIRPGPTVEEDWQNMSDEPIAIYDIDKDDNGRLIPIIEEVGSIPPNPTIEEVGQNPTIPPDGPNLTIEEVGPNLSIDPEVDAFNKKVSEFMDKYRNLK